jgi:salicylate hydroxylase
VNTSSTVFRNHQHLPIAIVGGGLGGFALAIGLLRHGVKVHIYEASPAFSEIGAGVTLGANATTALHLIDPRLFQGFMKHATFDSDLERDSTFMCVRWGMDERRENGHKAADYAYHQGDRRRQEGNLAEHVREGGYTEHDCWPRWSPYYHRAR